MIYQINKIGGVDFFKKELDLVKHQQPLEKRYIFDLFIVYADSLFMGVDMKLTEDVIYLKSDIQQYLIYFKEILASRKFKSIDACICIMEYNLNYIKNLRFLSA